MRVGKEELKSCVRFCFFVSMILPSFHEDLLLEYMV